MRFLSVYRTSISLFATLFFASAYVHQEAFRSEIPASRLDVLHALIIHRTFQIDAYHENTPDKAVYNGHYYCDKAPGVVVSTFPSFCLAVALLKLNKVPLDSDLGWLVSSWIACAISIGLVTALGGVASFIWLCRWTQPRHAFIATLALFLGSSPLPYSTLMMSHAFVVGLLGLSLWAGDGRPDTLKGIQPTFYRDVLAGFCCGLALASEYSSGVAVVGILLYLLYSRFWRIFPLSIGAALPLMLIPAYHWACFGDPLTLAYKHEATFTRMHDGFFGITFPPKLENAFLLLFSPQQGVCFWSPFLALAFVGYKRLYGLSRPLFWISYLVPLIQLVAISGYFYHAAGQTLGSRLLAPILPIMILPVALGVSRLPRVAVILTTISMVLTIFGTAIGAVLPTRGGNPILEFYLPRLIEGKLSYNLGSALGLSGHASLVPLVVSIGLGVWFGWRGLHLAPTGASPQN